MTTSKFEYGEAKGWIRTTASCWGKVASTFLINVRLVHGGGK